MLTSQLNSLILFEDYLFVKQYFLLFLGIKAKRKNADSNSDDPENQTIESKSFNCDQ